MVKLETIKDVIKLSIFDLIKHDKDLFSKEKLDNDVEKMNEFLDNNNLENEDEELELIKNKEENKEEILLRILYEPCINHRFAVYLEQHIKCKNLNEYNVDVEYNRNFGDLKQINGENVRPDILIHKRAGYNRDETVEVQGAHLLVVEAKIKTQSKKDCKKIIGFQTDEKFLYQYGLRVTYNIKQKVIADLFVNGVRKFKLEIPHDVTDENKNNIFWDECNKLPKLAQE
jgi:hypothetical protein